MPECNKCGGPIAYVGQSCLRCEEKKELKPTVRCGDLFLGLVRRFTGSDHCDSDACRQFSYGHMTGLAEKVYLGACQAAMNAPTHDDVNWMRSAHSLIADQYGLLTFEKRRNRVTELWFVKGAASYAALAAGVDDNATRGALCGIPALGIDPDYAIEKM